MQSLTIKHVTFGEGTPKICVSITGTTQKAILAQAAELRFVPCDLIEWRVDYYEDAQQVDSVLETLTLLRAAVKNRILLFTFRTQAEGGKQAINPYDYLWLNQKVAESQLADLIDLEYAYNRDRACSFVRFAHQKQVSVILSHHNFEKTPTAVSMVSLMMEMQDTGADLVKLAVMPQNPHDVLALLNASQEMAFQHAKVPIVTMSMGKLGRISRLVGESFGSCITFGTTGAPSAPGQLDVMDLSIALQMLHK